LPFINPSGVGSNATTAAIEQGAHTLKVGAITASQTLQCEVFYIQTVIYIKKDKDNKSAIVKCEDF